MLRQDVRARIAASRNLCLYLRLIGAGWVATKFPLVKGLNAGIGRGANVSLSATLTPIVQATPLST